MIGNADRHHENWGIIVNGDFKIAPTFDHAFRLASKVDEQEAKERLSTKDKGRSVEHFCKKAKSAFYKNDKRLSTIEVCEEILDFGNKNTQANQALILWIDKISQIQESKLVEILDNIPKEMGLKDAQKTFIFKVLRINTERLKNLAKGTK